MLFAKTIILTILGLGATTFAAPVEANTAVDVTPQDIQDPCERIPNNRDNLGRFADCEKARADGNRGRECRDIPRDRRPK